MHSLSARDLLLRYVRTGSREEESYLRLMPQLTAEEQERANRFVFAKDRLTFALGRVLVRKTLSQYGREPAAGWQFVWNSHGKPDLEPSPGNPPFRFNISHCTGMVITGFALEREIGVDVEAVDRTCGGIDIARSHFAADEVRFLASLPEDRVAQAFLSFWTLKESYIKARGLGLAIPLGDFAFTLDPPRIAFSPRLDDHSANWFFWQGCLATSHLAAVAARRAPAEELTLTLEEVPLGSLL